MKPWEETWYARNRTSCCTDVMVEGDTRECAFYGVVPCGDPKFPHADARARLAAAAPEMARLLLELEWSGLRTYQYEGGGDPVCPMCDADAPEGAFLEDAPKVVGHAPDCRLVAVLKRAGVL